MVQVAQPFEHPRLAPPVVRRRPGRRRTRRARAGSADSAGLTNAKRALRSGFFVRVELLIEDRRPRRHLADRELQRQRDVVGLGERQPGHRLVLLPDPLEPLDGRRRQRGVAQRGEPRRLQARRRRRVEPGAQRPLERAARRASAPAAGRNASRPRAGSRGCADVQLVASRAAARAARASRNAVRRDLAVEHLVPQRDPRAAARQRIVDVRQVAPCSQREAGGVEMKLAVADAAAVRQHETGAGSPRGVAAPRPRAAFKLHRDERATWRAAERDLQPLGPDQAALRIRIALRERRGARSCRPPATARS